MNARQAQRLAPPWAPLVAVAAALLTGTIAGLVWHSHRLPSLDAWASRELEARNDWVFWTARGISVALTALAIGAALSVAVSAWAVLRWRNAALLSLLAPALALTAEKLLKQLVARRAPGSTQFHFPSGHLAVMTAAAFSFVLVVRSTRPERGTRPVAIFASLCVAALALARQVDKAHLLSDVVGGVSTGVAATLAVAILLDHRLPNPMPYEETNR